MRNRLIILAILVCASITLWSFESAPEKVGDWEYVKADGRWPGS